MNRPTCGTCMWFDPTAVDVRRGEGACKGSAPAPVTTRNPSGKAYVIWPTVRETDVRCRRFERGMLPTWGGNDT